MQKLRIPLQGDPCGKIRHYSEAAAGVQLEWLVRYEVREGRGASARRLHVYRCRRCDAYHVGHAAFERPAARVGA